MYRATPQEYVQKQGFRSSAITRSKTTNSPKGHGTYRREPDLWYQTSSESLPAQPLWLRRAPSTNTLPPIPRVPLIPASFEPEFLDPSLPDTPDHCCFPKEFPLLPPPSSTRYSRECGRPSNNQTRAPPPLTNQGPPSRELPPLPAPRTRDNRRHCMIAMQSPVSSRQISLPSSSDIKHIPSSSSTLSSSSVATPHCHSSDSDSDTLDIESPARFQFPEPPSLSPLLRRMQSSPGFSHASFASVDELARRKRNVSLVQRGAEPIVRVHEPSLPPAARTTTIDTSLTRDDEDFSWEARTPPMSVSGDSGSPKSMDRHPVTKYTSPLLPSTFKQEPLERSSAPLSLIEEDDTTSSLDTHNHDGPSTDPRASTGYMNRVIRKVSSMKNPPSRSAKWDGETLEGHSGRSAALSRLDLSIEKLRAFGPTKDAHFVPASPNRARHVRSSSTGSVLSPSHKIKSTPTNAKSTFLASAAERPFPRHRLHQSEAINNPTSYNSQGQSNTRATSRPGPPLGTPFGHRPTRSHAVLSEFQYPRKLQKDRATLQPACFMDVTVTPEQELKRGESFRRVRKMISRASISLAGWGKGLQRKKSFSNPKV